jgi:glycolate oxidase FAD binding subunit
VDLIETVHPVTTVDVAEALRAASRRGVAVLPVGGRRHLDRGNPGPIDVELWTTQLDRVASYEPADMVAIVGGGMRVGELRRRLTAGGQEWPVDAPDDATVGGVIAVGASSPRRLRVGHVRDSVLRVELVTGDGRVVRAGAPTVKQSAGYGIARAVVGSLGTLGVITEVALKVRPLPRARRAVIATGDGLEVGARLSDAVPLPAAVLAEPDRVVLHLEGWPAEIEEQTEAARRVASIELDADETVPIEPFPDAPIVAEVAVPPSRLATVLRDRPRWRAAVGVGVAWVPVADAEDLAALRRAASEVGGIAPVVRGPGGLGPSPIAAPAIERRLKDAFDPAGILAPGRGWASVPAEASTTRRS